MAQPGLHRWEEPCSGQRPHRSCAGIPVLDAAAFLFLLQFAVYVA
ncbi:MAG TPA: hypothetical protein VKI99_16980 [Candidatus Dormibacteraeota bacterium]|nr:hypothetical protein [Candidatus Dormibacteraeota bacterium]